MSCRRPHSPPQCVVSRHVYGYAVVLVNSLCVMYVHVCDVTAHSL